MEHDYLLGKKTSRPLHAIAAEVCEAHRIDRIDFFSKRRFKPFVYARQEFCYRAKHETMASFPEIARIFGWDHTSVMHAARKYEQRMSKCCIAP